MYEKYAKIRDERGMKDSEVAKRAGISPSVLSDWKKGRYELRADKLKRIAAVLDVSIENLMGEEGYYVSPETAQIAQELFENRDLRLLFDAARDAKPEDLQMAAELIKRMKGTNRDS